MKVNASQVTGPALSYLVAKCLGHEDRHFCPHDKHFRDEDDYWFSPVDDWRQGGPIIEREGISVWVFDDVTWKAENPFTSGVDQVFEGPTPLIAAMRCFVASRLGDEVDIPESLVEGGTQ